MASEANLNRRLLGATLGATAAPAIAYGPSWSGVGNQGWWLLPAAIVVGALVGAFTWGLFRQSSDAPSEGFAALFGAAVGLVSGVIVSFPMGALLGAVAGAPAAACAAFVWARFLSFAPRARAGASLLGGALTCAVVAVGVTW